MRALTRVAVAAATVTLSTVATAVPAAAHTSSCAVVGPLVVSRNRFEGDLLGVCTDGTHPVRLHGWISGTCGNAVGFGFADDGVSSHFFVVGSNGVAWALAGQADGALALLAQGGCSETSATTFATHGSLTFV